MAIYSLNHKPIGKSTQERPYTAAAHVDYITRPKAMSRLEGERMPVSKPGAMGFLRSAEDDDRKNGRVADKVMLALPRELSPEQRAALVRSFANEVTQGKAPWLAAFHDKGKDASNPHCHLVIRDRDPETGRRVFGMSEKGSTQRLREAWTQHANGALEHAGSAERIDNRTLEAQGKPGPATIHEGPKPRAMERGGRRPRSRSRVVRNAPGAHRPNRRVDYPALDRGRSRAAFNADLKAQREREGWEAIDTDGRRRELEELRHLHVGRGDPSGSREEGASAPERGADMTRKKQDVDKPLPRGRTKETPQEDVDVAYQRAGNKPLSWGETIGKELAAQKAQKAEKDRSFSERMKQNREALARDPEARKERDARDLARMRASREADKDRER